MRNGKIYIGTSGWSYKHWKGKFYPANIDDSDEFDFYNKHFKTVELNSSFYHLPSAKTFSNWRIKSPAKFIFAVKASRFITHNKKLKTDDDSLDNFFMQACHLKEKLGPILFQLPPNWKLNLIRMQEFLSKLPNTYRYAFEFRNHTWFDPDVYELLRENNCALCIYDLERFMSPIRITADFIYIRFHGPGNKYQGSYTRQFLNKWALQLIKWRKEGKDIYIYFDNDQEGYAAINAQCLCELIKKRSSIKTKTLLTE